MAFSLEHVIPWGRSFAEYQRMFALTDADLRKRVLGCADGPASFNAHATERGAHVVSVDPLYAFSRAEIQARIDATYPLVMEQTRKNRDEFVWTEFESIEHLGRVRSEAMEGFLEDYEAGRQRGRYLSGELPRLPFDEQAFDLAVCSHFLFLYSAHLSEDFHLAAVEEMCRVAHEVRIFPLLELGGAASRHVSPVTEAMRCQGHRVEIVTVPYEFQRGGNQMLRIVRH
jgi:hypothetical protein